MKIYSVSTGINLTGSDDVEKLLNVGNIGNVKGTSSNIIVLVSQKSTLLEEYSLIDA